MAVPSTLNPWQEQGIPLDKQIRAWKDIVQEPYHKLDVDAYTRTRVILMNGIENEVWNFSHNFARCAGNREIRALLAATRRVEQQQQTTINWLNSAEQTVLETRRTPVPACGRTVPLRRSCGTLNASAIWRASPGRCSPMIWPAPSTRCIRRWPTRHI